MRWRGAVAVLGLLLACGPKAAAGGGTATPPAGTGPSALAGRVGQVLEVTVPLVGGGWQPLAGLRGKAVLLELGDAAVAGRDATQARWRALVEREGERVTVVCVAMDAEAGALPERWVDDPPPFVLGWDPQGALATRLQARALPTVVLLDARGTIVGVYEGSRPDEAAIERWVSGSASGR